MKSNGEMRSLATALYDDNSALIGMMGDLGLDSSEEGKSSAVLEKVQGFRYGRIEEVWNLTSPVEVVSNVPVDPFDPDGGSFRTATSNGQRFVIIGLGPDKDLDLTREVLEGPWMADIGAGPKEEIGARLGCQGCGTLAEALRVGAYTYSPTNGLDSDGDLVRFHQ